MLTLIKAQVTKYKSIEDSTPVTLAKHVTVLVGKNESGKTALLEALHKAMPLGSAKYDHVADSITTVLLKPFCPLLPQSHSRRMA